jgi:hypothetical protein
MGKVRKVRQSDSVLRYDGDTPITDKQKRKIEKMTGARFADETKPLLIEQYAKNMDIEVAAANPWKPPSTTAIITKHPGGYQDRHWVTESFEEAVDRWRIGLADPDLFGIVFTLADRNEGSRIATLAADIVAVIDYTKPEGESA